MTEPTGPLKGIRVVELAGIGPGPFACMWLADQGADVVRVERPVERHMTSDTPDILGRGRPSVAVDMKKEAGLEVVRRLVDRADVLVDTYRPGVTERLGLGPGECLARNPRLVYGRMTGWGQEGPLAARAGHDINYASITGAIAAIGEPGRKPVPPLNIIADMGGGAMFLIAGILSALVERSTSGRGQVIDAAMCDGAAYLLAMQYSMRAGGMWVDQRGSNLLDGGAPYYDCYECSDGEWLSVGAMEPQFFRALVETLGIADTVPEQNDMPRWPEQRKLIAEVIRTRTRDEWAEIFAEVDGCVAPVLWMGEAPKGAHLAARRTLVEEYGIIQPAPAPRLSRTPGRIGRRPAEPGENTVETLEAWGIPATEIEDLLAAGAVTQA